VQHPALVRLPDAIARRQQRVDDLVYRMAQAHRGNLASLLRRHEALDTRLRHQDMRVRLGEMRRQLEHRTNDLRTQARGLLAAKQTQSEQLTSALGRATETILLKQRLRWERFDGNLSALSPKAILSRGYALVFDAMGNLVKDASQLNAGDAVRAQLGRGEFTAEVKNAKPEPATE
jgi:exodeoxyribonuclease VII large subunit